MHLDLGIALGFYTLEWEALLGISMEHLWDLGRGNDNNVHYHYSRDHEEWGALH